MQQIVCCMVVSAVTSILITKKLATHYFEIVDNYVDDIVNKTKEFIETIKD